MHFCSSLEGPGKIVQGNLATALEEGGSFKVIELNMYDPRTPSPEFELPMFTICTVRDTIYGAQHHCGPSSEWYTSSDGTGQWSHCVNHLKTNLEESVSQVSAGRH